MMVIENIINDEDIIIYHGYYFNDKDDYKIIHSYNKNNKIHNLKDAAVIEKDAKEYYINGKEYSYEDWKIHPERIRELRSKKLK